MKLEKQVCSLELAKKLKESGFPYTRMGFTEHVIGDGTPNRWTSPTLEQLIEACGDRFSTLRLINPTGRIGEIEWLAESISKNTTGLTPTEAVAKLWLKLNPLKV